MLNYKSNKKAYGSRNSYTVKAKFVNTDSGLVVLKGRKNKSLVSKIKDEISYVANAGYEGFADLYDGAATSQIKNKGRNLAAVVCGNALLIGLACLLKK